MFGLPYVFHKAGWFVLFLYFIVLGLAVFFIHVLYLKTLRKLSAQNNLLGLTRIYLGENKLWIAFLSIIGGLILTLVVYLILANQFINLIFPGTSKILGIFYFWLVSSLPLFFNLRRFVSVELLGGILMGSIILFIYFSSGSFFDFGNAALNFKNLFLPFGVVLFSLAGWTAISPIYEWQKRYSFSAFLPLLFGTIIVVLLYLAFVAGIFGSAETITPDSVSGLLNWPKWKTTMLGALGLFAIWTSYLPIGFEIKHSLERDLGWKKVFSSATVLFLPLILVAVGLDNFLDAVGLAGGIFLSLQYFFIVLIVKKVLVFEGIKKLFLDFIAGLFLLASAYEIYYFIVV